MISLEKHERLKKYRKFLGLTQLQLASQMGTTSNSVARWESGVWPVTQATLNHVKALVERKLRDDILKFFSQINPELRLSKFEGLLGHPTADFTEDKDGKLYMGSAIILVHREHSLHCSVDDGQWFAINRAGISKKVNKAFLEQIQTKSPAKK